MKDASVPVKSTEDSTFCMYAFPPGTKIEAHSHDVPVLEYVVEGYLRTTADGTSKLYKAGDFYILEPGTTYELEVPSEEEGVITPYFGIHLYMK